MRVDRERDVLVGVAQALGYQGDRHAFGKYLACVRVPKRVEADTFDACLLHPFDHTGPEAIRRIMSTGWLAEDELVILIRGAE